MKRKLLLPLVAVVPLAIYGWTSSAASAVVVAGTVEDPSGSELRGIGVRAVRSGSNIAETTTDDDGAYRLELPGGGAFDLVFDEPEYQPAVLTALSGNTEHRISKVMLREGQFLDDRSGIAARFAEEYLRSLEGGF